MLDGELLEAQAVVGELHRALGVVGFIGGEHDVVIEHVDPGVADLVVEGIRAVRQDVREGLVLGDVHLNRCGGLQIRAHLPGHDMGVAAVALYGCGKQLQAAVVVEIRHGIGPLGVGAFRLLEGVEVVKKILDLGIRGLIGGSHRCGGSRLCLRCRGGLRAAILGKRGHAQGENHHQHQYDRNGFLHCLFLSSFHVIRYHNCNNCDIARVCGFAYVRGSAQNLIVSLEPT